MKKFCHPQSIFLQSHSVGIWPYNSCWSNQIQFFQTCHIFPASSWKVKSSKRAICIFVVKCNHKLYACFQSSKILRPLHASFLSHKSIEILGHEMVSNFQADAISKNPFHLRDYYAYKRVISNPKVYVSPFGDFYCLKNWNSLTITFFSFFSLPRFE